MMKSIISLIAAAALLAAPQHSQNETKIPILLYHCISDDIKEQRPSYLYVSPASMEEQLEALRFHGYTAVTFEDFPLSADITKPVMLTFDDGYRDNYTELFPLLKKYNSKATIFVKTDIIGDPDFLTADHIKEMDASGLVSFQSHTATHPALDTCEPEVADIEFARSSDLIEELLGKRPFVLAYPYGRYNKETIDIAKKHYEFAMTIKNGAYLPGNTAPYEIPRNIIGPGMDLKAFAKLLTQTAPDAKKGGVAIYPQR